MRTTVIPILAALALSTPAAAETATATVQVADFDLSDPTDIARLESRISRTVRVMCGPRFNGSVNRTRARRECRASAQLSVDEALARLLNPEQRRVLVALSEGRSRD